MKKFNIEVYGEEKIINEGEKFFNLLKDDYINSEIPITLVRLWSSLL